MFVFNSFSASHLELYKLTTDTSLHIGQAVPLTLQLLLDRIYSMSDEGETNVTHFISAAFDIFDHVTLLKAAFL